MAGRIATWHYTSRDDPALDHVLSWSEPLSRTSGKPGRVWKTNLTGEVGQLKSRIDDVLLRWLRNEHHALIDNGWKLDHRTGFASELDLGEGDDPSGQRAASPKERLGAPMQGLSWLPPLGAGVVPIVF